MAHKGDIESDITLELNGDVSPNQLAKALNALSALLNSGHRQVDPDKTMQWSVQVKKGSNLVGFYPTATPVNPVVIDNIQRGLVQLESGVDKPNGFSESMMHNLRTLCDISKDTKNKKTNVRLWLRKEASDITMTIKSNVDIALAGEFEEHGAVEGRLQILDAHDGQFVIFESLSMKKILCAVENDEVFTQAYKLFEKRVEAEGLIKYSASGLPYEILVDRFNLIPEATNIQDYKSTRGILKEYV